jgi:D-arabinose 1-dehydrogenase-like Zn-dependent alcohol dehydrogenase
MEVRVLQTTGAGWFKEVVWTKPEPTEWQIEVQAAMTGVCRSDIDMMNGDFGPLPLTMQGHEGLGIVTKVGDRITDVVVGDYVATRGEPAYADFYNVEDESFVKVPELDPKYILEPVACALNCIHQPIDELRKRPRGRVLILGSGFLAWIIYNALYADPTLHFPEVDVVGSSNRELWADKLKSAPEGVYNIVFDLSSRTDIFDQPILSEHALIVFGAQKTVTTDFANLLWKACTMIFPSPRHPGFYHSMRKARDLIQNGQINVDKFWTKAYNRNTEWRQAFEDGNNRPQGYSRGYIKWNINGN